MAEQEQSGILLPPAADVTAEYLEGWCDGQAYLLMNTTPDAVNADKAVAEAWWLGGWSHDLDAMPNGIAEVAFDEGLGSCSVHVCSRYIASPTLVNGYPVPRSEWQYGYKDCELREVNTHNRRAYAWRPIPAPPPRESWPDQKSADTDAERFIAYYGAAHVRSYIARKIALATPAPDKALMPEAAVGGELDGHFRRMQEACANYLEPTTYVARHPDLSRIGDCPWVREFLMPEATHSPEAVKSINDRRDAAFISDIIYMLDGPEQRAAQGTPTPVEEPEKGAAGEVGLHEAATDLLRAMHDGQQHVGYRLVLWNRLEVALAATNAGQVEAAYLAGFDAATKLLNDSFALADVRWPEHRQAALDAFVSLTPASREE